MYTSNLYSVSFCHSKAHTHAHTRVYFQSKRLHVEPSTSSWFTHNLGLWLLQLQFSRVCCACVGSVDFLLYFEMTKCNKSHTKASLLSKHMSVAPWSNYQETTLPPFLFLSLSRSRFRFSSPITLYMSVSVSDPISVFRFSLSVCISRDWITRKTLLIYIHIIN